MASTKDRYFTAKYSLPLAMVRVRGDGGEGCNRQHGIDDEQSAAQGTPSDQCGARMS